MFSSEVTEVTKVMSNIELTKVSLLDLLNECPDISNLIFFGNILALRQTCKGMKEMIKIPKIRITIKNKDNYNGERLLEKLNSLNVWCKVIKLDIIKCNLDVGARAIADALRVNSTLHALSLENNDIGDDSARAIADALRVNSILQSLNLKLNYIGDDSARAIADALRVNSTLHALSLENNDIGDDGALAIAETLRVNSTLKELDLLDNGIGADGARAIAEALLVNSTL